MGKGDREESLWKGFNEQATTFDKRLSTAGPHGNTAGYTAELSHPGARKLRPPHPPLIG